MSDEPGRVEYEFVAPDMVRVWYYGRLEGPELATLFDWMDDQVGSLAHCLVEADMSGVKTASPNARRLAADRLAQLPKLSVAVVSSNFAQRMIAKLVLTAMELLRRGQTRTAFFKNSEDAQQWLAKERAQLNASQDK